METVNVLIVDDIEEDALRVENAIRTKNMSQTIYYDITVCHGIACYPEAVDYIKEHHKKIDIVFSDFGIHGGGNGLLLFQEFLKYNRRPFRILHSTTHSNLSENMSIYNTGGCDEICRTKNHEEVIKKLEIFEKEILPIKKYGNPNFTEDCLFHNKLPKWKNNLPDAQKELLHQLVSIQTDLRKNNIHLRGSAHAEQSILFEPFKNVNSITNLLSQNSGLFPFAHLNRSTLVNLLWVSKLEQNLIRFITPDSFMFTLEFKKWSTDSQYTKTYINYLKRVSTNIHRHFLMG